MSLDSVHTTRVWSQISSMGAKPVNQILDRCGCIRLDARACKNYPGENRTTWGLDQNDRPVWRRLNICPNAHHIRTGMSKAPGTCTSSFTFRASACSCSRTSVMATTHQGHPEMTPAHHGTLTYSFSRRHTVRLTTPQRPSRSTSSDALACDVLRRCFPHGTWWCR